MKLHGHFRSTASFRVRIALNLKRLSFESIPVQVRRDEHRAPDYLALNPQALLPALEDGGTAIPQSLAIIEYLEERYPQPPLLPASPSHRALVRSMALTVACEMHPLNNLRVLNYLRTRLGLAERAVTGTWYHHWIDEGFRGLEEQARRASGDGRHMFGTSVTLADVFVFPQLYNATAFNCDLAPYPTLRGVGAHLASLEAFARALPEAQPDAPPPVAS